MLMVAIWWPPIRRLGRLALWQRRPGSWCPLPRERRGLEPRWLPVAHPFVSPVGSGCLCPEWHSPSGRTSPPAGLHLFAVVAAFGLRLKAVTVSPWPTRRPPTVGGRSPGWSGLLELGVGGDPLRCGAVPVCADRAHRPLVEPC